MKSVKFKTLPSDLYNISPNKLGYGFLHDELFSKIINECFDLKFTYTGWKESSTFNFL